jgi:drug/metabolite transporter (DMT)-like permease
LVSFVGILVIVQPGAASIAPLGFAVAMIGAFSTGLVSITLRHMTRTESPPSIVFWFGVLSVPPMALLMIPFGQAHSPEIFALLLLMGVTGSVSQILQTFAFRWGSVAVVVPMDYSAILWSSAIGWLFWDALPSAAIWIGAALIAAGSLYVLLNEHRRRFSRD